MTSTISISAGRRAAGAALLAGTLLGAGCGGDRAAPDRPNVLLIVMDTTRWDHLSCYGYGRATTPHVDRVAAEGVLYENATTPGSWTLPSHATLFTGLYPRDHDTTCEHTTLEPVFDTLAEELAAAGYQTAAFSNNVWLSKSSGLQQGFEEFHELWREHYGRDHPDDGAAMTTERVLGWLDDREQTDSPFFIFINYFEPHLPYRAPEPWGRRFLPANADPEAVAELRSWQHPREVGYILGVPGMEVSPEQFALLETQYDGEIAYLDSRMGELFEGLRRRGLFDGTIVAITSDHGEHFGDHGLMDHKMSLYEALIHVPLILRYPPALPPGRRVRDRVQTNDVFATLLHLSGVERVEPRGSTRLPLEDRAGVRERVFAEFGNPRLFLEVLERSFPGVDYSAFDRSLKAVSDGRYKLIRPSPGPPELYDLTLDPSESDNLADRLPAERARLGGLLDAFERDELPFLVREEPVD